MPYVKKERRAVISGGPGVWKNHTETAGELNYAITELVMGYLKTKGEAYQTYNDILGALEGCKLELYRRRVAGYEDKKCAEAGDVY